MPENPLLPNKKLQQLYASMLRARAGAGRRSRGLEAILAAVALLLEPGDAVVSSDHGNAFAELLGPAKRAASAARSLHASAYPLAFSCGVAAGAQVAGNSGLVAVLLDGRGPEPDWPALLERAQSDRLPLIVICLDTEASPRATDENALTWTSVSRVSKKLRFPILTVSGEDAVAMVRALQESVLRARHGDGPALLWCLTPSPGAPSQPGVPPLEALERYLAARRIALPRTARLSPRQPVPRR